LDLSHIEHGTGSPVIILHGLYGSARNWNAIAKRLGAGYRVFALDLRNHGNSPWADSMNYVEMAGDVAEFIRRHALQGAAIIGHSMGGKVAMTLALKDGGLVGRLVIADIAPVPYGHDLDALLGAMEVVSLEGVERRSEVDDALAGAIPEPMIRAFLLQNLVRDGGGWVWRVNLAAVRACLDEIAGFPEADGAYDAPTLFVAGEKSKYIRAEYSETINRLFPGARTVPIPGAGHWVHADQPELFVKTMEEFLGGE
jgi:pimeloyl-ACP methyl ester carboxylesterase